MASPLELFLLSGSSGFDLALKKGEMGFSVPLSARSLNRDRAEAPPGPAGKRKDYYSTSI